MQPGFVVYIVEYVFMVMAMHAKLSLPLLARGVMAFVALLLEFFMALDHGPGHQYRFQVACMVLRRNKHNRYREQEPETHV